MTTEFRKFLKFNNAYDKYIKNNKGESENPYTDFQGFHWEDTPEGYEYWCTLDDLWLEYLENEGE